MSIPITANGTLFIHPKTGAPIILIKCIVILLL